MTAAPGEHRLFVANAVYPHFRSTPTRYRDFSARAPRIAGLIKDSGADCAVLNEAGYRECATLSDQLPWQYDRAQGRGRSIIGEGLNSCWSEPGVWDQPEDRLVDVNMPSGDEAQRTLLLARLIEKAGGPDSFFTLGALHETLAQAAGLDYVKAMVKAVGGKRVLLAGDFKRTGDDDDLALMARSGFTVHERTSATPMTCFTKGKVRVLDVEHRTDSRCFDHGYLVVSFTIPTGEVPAA